MLPQHVPFIINLPLPLSCPLPSLSCPSPFLPLPRPSSARPYSFLPFPHSLPSCPSPAPLRPLPTPSYHSLIPSLPAPPLSRFFPAQHKVHLSHDVLLLCVNCHQLSSQHDTRRRQSLAAECNAPLHLSMPKQNEDSWLAQVKSHSK